MRSPSTPPAVSCFDSFAAVLPGRPETRTVQSLGSPPTEPIKPCGPSKIALLMVSCNQVISFSALPAMHCCLHCQLCCRPAWQARNKHCAVSYVSPDCTHQALWSPEEAAIDCPPHGTQRNQHSVIGHASQGACTEQPLKVSSSHPLTLMKPCLPFKSHIPILSCKTTPSTMVISCRR